MRRIFPDFRRPEDRVHKLRLLWVDFSVSQRETALPAQLAATHAVSHAIRTQAIGHQVQRARCDVVFFDFDYPDQVSLRTAASLKQEHPSVPMVMLTVQHSEALAVWAFRSRFADYLVKPVPDAELGRCLAMLDDMTSERRGQQSRSVALTHATPVPDDVPLPSAATSALLPALYYAEKNYPNKIVNEDAARLCGMSPFRFGRLFKDAFGMTFRDYVVKLRLQEAGRLLQNPHASVTEVTYSVGFNDISYFSRMFKRHFGVSPSAMQEQAARTGPPAPELTAPLLLPELRGLN